MANAKKSPTKAAKAPTKQAVKAIPDRFHSLTPYLTLADAATAIDWYKAAFGATEIYRMPMPDGKIAHAELMIGDSVLMLSEEMPEYGSKGPKSLGGCAGAVHLYHENVDEVWARAIEHGATALQPLMDAFWGDRFGKLADPFGQVWSLATHKEDLSPEEIHERAAKAMSGGPC